MLCVLYFFRLVIEGYSGTAGDSLNYNNGQQFSTWDVDNDSTDLRSCAVNTAAGWWHNECTFGNPNGVMRVDGRGGFNTAFWLSLDDRLSMQYIEMKLRCI